MSKLDDPAFTHARAKKAGAARTGVDYHIRKLLEAPLPFTRPQLNNLRAIVAASEAHK